MANTYEVSATAKINLYLRVCGNLPNSNYHRLHMLMQEITLCDDVEVFVDDEGEHDIIAECIGCDPIPNNKNLCYKAAVRFFSALKKRGTVRKLPFVKITIKKNIPSEAGIGGGSSDAAAVILCLAEHYGNPFSVEELNEIAANTGADTPFFLYGGACVCEGFGEVVTPIESLSDLPLILIKPKDGVSTPQCFSSFDSKHKPTLDESLYDGFKAELAASDSPIEVIRNHKELMVNDLQEPAEEFVPDIRTARELLEHNGALFAAMSGSGSCVFGVFEDKEKRDLAFAKISEDKTVSDKDYKLFKCETA